MDKKTVTNWDVRVGESIAIGPNIRIRVEAKSGQQARIRVECPDSMSVGKSEPGVAAFARSGVRIR